MSLPEYMTLNLEDDIHTTDIKPPYGDSWDDVSIEDRCQIAAVLIDDGIHSRDIHHSCDLKSIQMYRITNHRWWRRSIVMVALVNLCLAFFEGPCVNTPCAPNSLLLTIESVCLLVYTIDTTIEICARGSNHFFKSGWNKAKIPFILFSWIWIFVPHSLRIQRMIRPFFMLAYAHNLRMVMNSMFKGMAAVTYIGTLLLFHLIIFAIIGTKFFAKVSPTEFGTFYRSCISLFTLLTTANYPNVMLNAMDSSLFNVIFFIVFLVVGLFIFLNLALATVFNSYKERIEHDLLVHKNRAKIAFQAAFKLCDPEGTGAVEKQIFVLVFKYLRPSEMNIYFKV